MHGRRNTPMFFMLQLLNRNMNLRPISVVVTRSYTHTDIHMPLDQKSNNTADVPFHDKVPGQSNHRKYSQDKSSQHNNKTLALWAMMPA